jgi:hypothetical protein
MISARQHGFKSCPINPLIHYNMKNEKPKIKTQVCIGLSKKSKPQTDIAC